MTEVDEGRVELMEDGRSYRPMTIKPSLAWRPHEGEPHMTPTEALRLYREKRSEALSRTVMTEEQRADFVGDAKPS